MTAAGLFHPYRDLEALDPIDMPGADQLGTAALARILLADLAHHDALTPEQRRDPLVMARRLRLVADLRELRARLG